ncbi:G patch domain and KOW motifs-containing protein [Fopius arisanus]|uniref:G patch domain and KOW motifs-containing protein n=1 Tax=Fopius arisanus TaxID=64838 RepID=A0A9R1TKB6_9HYME|nr:PREDICTED: G patch domain and KOW motifs-containing protein [Fopius arisanus]
MIGEGGKKISFGFSKSIKKPVLKNVAEPEAKKIDFIDYLDEKTIKIIGEEEKNDEPLVIPMLGSRTWHDRIINKVDADIFETKLKNEESDEKADEKNSKLRVPNGNVSSDGVPMDISGIKKEPDDEITVSLEEQAAQEILNDLGKDVKVEPKDLTLPLHNTDNLEGQRESTLEDYEQIPIESYGLAMLRGMGWQPGKGLGKNEQHVEPKIPELRPRGMGLGADKAVLKAKNVEKKTKEQEQLQLIVGAFVKILGGKHHHNYGVLEGLDEDSGRLIVKLTIGGESVSLNECLVEPVTKDEYTKYSKILNASKFAEYKDKANADRQKLTSNSNSSDSNRKRKSDDSSDDDRRSHRRRCSSSSSDDRYEKKTKKKHRNRNRSSSSDEHRKKSKKHSSRKNKKKEKTRDRSRERKSRYSESLDRRKNRKHHRRSRS